MLEIYGYDFLFMPLKCQILEKKKKAWFWICSWLKVKYVGQEQEALQNKGLNMMDKTLLVGGARISYSIWEVEGMQIFLYFFFSFLS